MTIRGLIREFLLQEEVFGAQAFIYHGSKAPPGVLVPALLSDKYKPGTHWKASFYGRALYTTYKLKDTATGTGFYGEYVYKFKVNLHGFISFDPDVTRKIYKKDLSVVEQGELVGLDDSTLEMLKQYRVPAPGRPTSDGARWASAFLRGKVKGLIFTGRHDGQVVCIYDPTIAAPIAWKKTNSNTWNKIDRESIKPSLRHSASGDWEYMKYADVKTPRPSRPIPKFDQDDEEPLNDIT
jgi:hypothetical protein